MAHCRAERELHVDRSCDCNRKRLNRRELSEIELFICERPPKSCRHQRNEDKQPEKCLRNTGVKDTDFIFHHGDAKATENSLRDHATKRDHAEIAHPLPIFTDPEPDRENNRQKANERSH